MGEFSPLLVFVYQQIFLKRFMINHEPLQQDLCSFRILGQLVLIRLHVNDFKFTRKQLLSSLLIISLKVMHELQTSIKFILL